MTLQEEVEMLDRYRRLRSEASVAHHIKINESSARTIVQKEKELCGASLQLCQQSRKPCTFYEIPCSLVLKMQRLLGCRIAIGKAKL